MIVLLDEQSLHRLCRQLAGWGIMTVVGHTVGSQDREAPTAAQLGTKLAELPPGRASAILATTRVAPHEPPPEDGSPPQPPAYRSWTDFLARTTPAERRRWAAAKTRTANRERLMSGVPATTITAEDVLSVLATAEGRCAHCGSLAVERRPSGIRGAPLPWARVGRRIGSLAHVVSRFHGGANSPENLAWSCLWCNTWQSERRPGATDHGAVR